MAFTLPDLPYAYDALQPHMSKETLEFHHDKHHKAYLDAMTPMIEGTDYASMPIEEIVKKSYSDNPKLFNQAGQYYNHIHFWKWMKPAGGGKKLPASSKSRSSQGSRLASTSSGAQVHRRRQDAVRLRLGLARAEGRQARRHEHAERREPAGARRQAAARRRSCGSTPTIIDYRNLRPKYLETWFDNLVNWDYVAELYEKG